MHPDISPRKPLFPVTPAMMPRVSGLRRLMSAVMRTWQRRKMIATFEAMDDWMLKDIGLRREDIVRTVNSFEEMRIARRAPERAMSRSDITPGVSDSGSYASAVRDMPKAA